MKSINIKAYAKLNTFFDIHKKNSNGYHEILTAMQMIDLADDVQINADKGSGIHIKCSNPNIPADSRNTAYKAADLFLEKLGKQVKLEILINKRIPVMAGLGGSSADASAVLRGLNGLAGKPFTHDELLAIGAEIGADVPFLIQGGYAFCTGTGANIVKALPELGGAFLIIKPDFDCPTEEAYALYDKKPVPASENTDFFLYNVFERVYNNKKISSLKQELIQTGALGACLSGSGSAVYGFFEDLARANHAYNKLNYTQKFVSLPMKRLEN